MNALVNKARRVKDWIERKLENTNEKRLCFFLFLISLASLLTQISVSDLLVSGAVLVYFLYKATKKTKERKGALIHK